MHDNAADAPSESVIAVQDDNAADAPSESVIAVQDDNAADAPSESVIAAQDDNAADAPSESVIAAQGDNAAHQIVDAPFESADLNDERVKALLLDDNLLRLYRTGANKHICTLQRKITLMM